MTPQEFCYWLQGCFEIGGEQFQTLNEKQVMIIKNHLNLVFEHAIDPQYGDEKKQQILQEIHDNGVHPAAENTGPKPFNNDFNPPH